LHQKAAKNGQLNSSKAEAGDSYVEAAAAVWLQEIRSP